MAGIVFLRTQKLEEITEFFQKQIDCSTWLSQPDCTILRHGNFLFGFCTRDTVQHDVMLTFFYHSRAEVDRMYKRLRSRAESEPVENEKYGIYQFFARDPENRMLEFQYFDHDLPPFLSSDELLLTRRSIRRFTDQPIPESLLTSVCDLSRFAPTARNSQPYYLKLVKDNDVLKRLAEVRGASSAPIGRAPIAVAIVADPAISKRHIQDGCIAAYHLLLAAWTYGLGTCWIAAMDRDDVKELLGIPKDHYVATVTPLGYPEGDPPAMPERKGLDHYLRE